MMSKIARTPAAPLTDIPAIAPAPRLVEDRGGGVGVGEGDLVVAVVGEEVRDDDEAVVVASVPTPAPVLEFVVRATVFVYLVFAPQPYPSDPLWYTYSAQ
jgi:hypothetical protein